MGIFGRNKQKKPRGGKNKNKTQQNTLLTTSSTKSSQKPKEQARAQEQEQQQHQQQQHQQQHQELKFHQRSPPRLDHYVKATSNKNKTNNSKKTNDKEADGMVNSQDTSHGIDLRNHPPQQQPNQNLTQQKKPTNHGIPVMDYFEDVVDENDDDNSEEDSSNSDSEEESGSDHDDGHDDTNAGGEEIYYDEDEYDEYTDLEATTERDSRTVDDTYDDTATYTENNDEDAIPDGSNFSTRLLLAQNEATGQQRHQQQHQQQQQQRYRHNPQQQDAKPLQKHMQQQQREQQNEQLQIAEIEQQMHHQQRMIEKILEEQEERDRTRDLVKVFIGEIWNRGEIESIEKVCSPRLRFNGHTGLERVGHEGFSNMVTTVRSSLEGYHCEIHCMVVEGRKCFCRLKFTGKHVGKLMGYPPTHKQVAWMGASEFTVCPKRRTIMKVWELGDIKTLEAQLS